MDAPKGLDSLFKEKLFRIPDYQRGYAWQCTKPNLQLNDFWDDLVNLQDNHFHYTGVITLSEIDSDKILENSNEYWLVNEHSYTVFQVVDGQQRLTTCIIFIQSLVDFIKNLPVNQDKDYKDIFLTENLTLKSITDKFIYQQKPTGDMFRTYKFGYDVDNPSHQFMRYRIFNEPDSGKIEETFYTLNLKNAKTFFIGQLEALYQEEGLKGIQELYKKITKKFLFNEYNIKDEFDVFVAFETMNNRGKNLSKLELLKNRLIYLTMLYPVVELDIASRTNLRNEINNAWKEVYSQLGRNDKRPLNDDDFLKSHWIMKFMYSRKNSDDYINFLLNGYFSPKKIYKKFEKEIKIEHPVEQHTDFEFDDSEDENGSDEVKVITYSALQPIEITKYVNNLKASAVHWFNTHFPFLANELSDEEKKWIDKLNRIGMGYFRPLIMSILKNVPQSIERVNVLKQIERFIFINFHLNRAMRNYGDSEFYNAARELDQGTIKIDKIIEKLKFRTDYTFYSDGSFKIKSFAYFMYKKFHEGEKLGFYRWHGLNYFLYEYELKKMEESGQSKVDWELFTKSEKDKISIEHICPQTKTEYWEKAFENIPDDQLHLYSGSLGNLLLLSSSINSSLQNDSYPDKLQPKTNDKGETIRKGYKDGSHSEIEVSLDYKEKWTSEEITKRGLHLLKFMEERWAINLGSDENKLSILQLTSNTQ